MLESFKLKAAGAWRSFTIWFNGVMAALLIYADNIIGALRDTLPTVSQWLTSDILKGAAVLIIIGNIALRFKTDKSLAEK